MMCIAVYHRKFTVGNCVYHRQIQNGKPYVYNWQTGCGKQCLTSANSLWKVVCLSSIIGKFTVEAACLSQANCKWDAVCLSSAYSLCEVVCLSSANSQWEAVCLSSANSLWEVYHRKISCGKSVIGIFTVW